MSLTGSYLKIFEKYIYKKNHNRLGYRIDTWNIYIWRHMDDI